MYTLFHWRTLLPTAICLALLVIPCQEVTAQADLSASMVSVKVSANRWNAKVPWLAHKGTFRRGSAVVLAKQRLLTTASMIANAQVIQVRKHGLPTDYIALVDRVDYASNLALLSVNNASFWQSLRALPLAQPPAKIASLTINRWRAGHFEKGNADIIRYNQHVSSYDLLLETPALWVGTSLQKVRDGEATILNNQLIGITAYQNKNEVRIIPGGLLRNFAQSAQSVQSQSAQAKSDAGELFVHRGFAWQDLNHPHLRENFSLPQNGQGVRVNEIFSEGSGSEELRVNDILLKIMDLPIDAEGSILHPRYGHIAFNVMLNDTSSSSIPIQLLRNQELMTVNVKRKRLSPDGLCIPQPIYDAEPQYFVFGGLILQELNLGYLQSWGSNWRKVAPQRLALEFMIKQRRLPNQKKCRVLIISKVLSDPINLDYQVAVDAIIQSVNGLEVNSLAELKQALVVPSGQHHIINLISNYNVGLLVFPISEIEQANQRIAKRYQIP